MGNNKRWCVKQVLSLHSVAFNRLLLKKLEVSAKENNVTIHEDRVIVPTL